MPKIKVPAVQVEPKELLIKFQEALVDPKVQEFLFLKKQVDKALPSIKKSIGNEMLQNNEKKRNIGDNIEISTVAVTKPRLIDETLVPEDYYTVEELNQDSIIVQDGKIYQKVLNTELIKNSLKLGVNIAGYVLEQSPRVTIKINGESI